MAEAQRTELLRLLIFQLYYPVGFADELGPALHASAIKWVKPLCFGVVLVLLGDAHAVALSIQGPIVWQLTLPSLHLPAERRAEHSCVSL